MIVSVIDARLESVSHELSVPPQPDSDLWLSGCPTGASCTASRDAGRPGCMSLFHQVSVQRNLELRRCIASLFVCELQLSGVDGWRSGRSPLRWRRRHSDRAASAAAVGHHSTHPPRTLFSAPSTAAGTHKLTHATRHCSGRRRVASAVASGSGGEARAARVSQGSRMGQGKNAFASQSHHNCLLCCNSPKCR